MEYILFSFLAISGKGNGNEMFAARPNMDQVSGTEIGNGRVFFFTDEDWCGTGKPLRLRPYTPPLRGIIISRNLIEVPNPEVSDFRSVMKGFSSRRAEAPPSIGR